MQNGGSGGGCAFQTAANQSGGANIFEVYNRVLIWDLDVCTHEVWAQYGS